MRHTGIWQKLSFNKFAALHPWQGFIPTSPQSGLSGFTYAGQMRGIVPLRCRVAIRTESMAGTN